MTGDTDGFEVLFDGAHGAIVTLCRELDWYVHNLNRAMETAHGEDCPDELWPCCEPNLRADLERIRAAAVEAERAARREHGEDECISPTRSEEPIIRWAPIVHNHCEALARIRPAIDAVHASLTKLRAPLSARLAAARSLAAAEGSELPPFDSAQLLETTRWLRFHFANPDSPRLRLVVDVGPSHRAQLADAVTQLANLIATMRRIRAAIEGMPARSTAPGAAKSAAAKANPVKRRRRRRNTIALTNRQSEVIETAARLGSTRAAARDLGIAPSTAREAFNAAQRKLGEEGRSVKARRMPTDRRGQPNLPASE